MNYQAVQCIELMDDGEVVDQDWHDVGPEFITPSGVMNYVESELAGQSFDGMYVRDIQTDTTIDYEDFHNTNKRPNNLALNLEGGVLTLAMPQTNPKNKQIILNFEKHEIQFLLDEMAAVLEDLDYYLSGKEGERLADKFSEGSFYLEKRIGHMMIKVTTNSFQTSYLVIGNYKDNPNRREISVGVEYTSDLLGHIMFMAGQHG